MQKAIKKWLGFNYQEALFISQIVPSYHRLQIWRAIQKLLTVEQVVSYNDEFLQIPAIFLQASSGYKQTELSLYQGVIFGIYNGKNVVIQFIPNDRSLVIQMFTKDDADFCHEFLNALIEESKKCSPYIGQKLNYMGGGLSFMPPVKTLLSDVILDKEICKIVNEQFIYPIKNQKNIIASGLPLKRGLLINGKPGTGKTIFGKALMNECKDTTMIVVTAKSLQYVDDIYNAFEYARDFYSHGNVPTIVFFEDIDLIGAHREINFSRNMLGELLTQLDGVEDNEGIYVIGSTNNKEILDAALSARPGRFDIVIEFGLPKMEERKKIINMYNFNLDNSILEAIAETTDGFTPAQIKEVLIKTKIFETSNNRKITPEELLTLLQYTQNIYLGIKPPTTYK